MQRWKVTRRKDETIFRCSIGCVRVSGGVIHLYSGYGTLIGSALAPAMSVAKFLSCVEFIMSHTKNTYRV